MTIAAARLKLALAGIVLAGMSVAQEPLRQARRGMPGDTSNRVTDLESRNRRQEVVQTRQFKCRGPDYIIEGRARKMAFGVRESSGNGYRLAELEYRVNETPAATRRRLSIGGVQRPIEIIAAALAPFEDSLPISRRRGNLPKVLGLGGGGVSYGFPEWLDQDKPYSITVIAFSPRPKLATLTVVFPEDVVSNCTVPILFGDADIVTSKPDPAIVAARPARQAAPASSEAMGLGPTANLPLLKQRDWPAYLADRPETPRYYPMFRGMTPERPRVHFDLPVARIVGGKFVPGGYEQRYGGAKWTTARIQETGLDNMSPRELIAAWNDLIAQREAESDIRVISDFYDSHIRLVREAYKRRMRTLIDASRSQAYWGAFWTGADEGFQVGIEGGLEGATFGLVPASEWARGQREFGMARGIGSMTTVAVITVGTLGYSSGTLGWSLAGEGAISTMGRTMAHSFFTRPLTQAAVEVFGTAGAYTLYGAQLRVKDLLEKAILAYAFGVMEHAGRGDLFRLPGRHMRTRPNLITRQGREERPGQLLLLAFDDRPLGSKVLAGLSKHDRELMRRWALLDMKLGSPRYLRLPGKARGDPSNAWVMGHGPATPAMDGFDYTHSTPTHNDLNVMRESARRRLEQAKKRE